MTDTTKPQCKVRGMLSSQAICGHIVTGGKDCGFAGTCRFQIPQAAAEIGKMKGEK